ncbi:cytochrome C biogenesis protein [Alkalihalobacillus alcalophilus ATCC 27647 = CGMCC 1.3604]|uniref:Cytochrome C biogenesis protein n=1 Tax=Alkalihalobacillus alcalophilus ATCC 27647 = CGMCC 1.3604 TaxID=1218173 RepID=A0A094YYD8_ALKAL|nr:cytochrome c biogenesis protein ResB [Alkalihalobacillus alcalophilus]KGA98552.1 cytochrome C biogenesis protein [Alkalihalobacillus alcalophilus ATCC 27647 = CGMCC 1.3604]MED1560393.1 cytochrome c biogenesis protein ResB [Alkalihalobacillus alcalophilus]THG89185.1 cytochrome C biogenesis protein [Alkalihalobacillus alcalophilus ATCC 27647 = CGMCC 1.3604]
MDKIKCECGHLNPHGTIICESCGKPLGNENDDKTLLNMRYEGVARRSQTYKSNIIDKIWMFFSSVKVGIWIIVILLVASIFGTIFPQQFYIGGENPAVFYQEEYGTLGELYYQLGFHNLYSSWWYMALIAALGVSLIIASLDRAVPLYRALKKQRITRHQNFMKRQRVFGFSKITNIDEQFDVLKARLKAKKYNVREENGNLVAEKGRFSRWGPYVNHLGIILFLVGCMLRYFPGFYVDEHVWVREGEYTVVPGTNQELYIGNEQFIIEFYDPDDEIFRDSIERAEGTVVKTYQTNAVLYEADPDAPVGVVGDLEEVARSEIRVNEPLKYKGFNFYQLDYKMNELQNMSFTVENKETGERFGRLDIDLNDPEKVYDLGDGYTVTIIEYFPNYYLNSNNEPATRSSIPDNPAFIFNTVTPLTPEGERSFVGIMQNYELPGTGQAVADVDHEFKLSFIDVDMSNVTGLGVRKDLTLPLLIAGGTIFMIGLIQGSYWAHRRIWFQRMNGEVWIAGHTNKNWLTLRTDIKEVIKDTGLLEPVDQAEEKEKQDEIENQKRNQEG